MIDLATVVLTRSFEWGIGKILDVMWKCSVPECKELTEERISNVSHNTLRCPNCSKIVTQFTNACEATIRADKTVSHIGVQFTGTLPYKREYSVLGFKTTRFGSVNSRFGAVESIQKCRIDFATRCVDFAGRQVILFANLSDYKNQKNYEEYHAVESILKVDETFNKTLLIPPVYSGKDVYMGLLAVDVQITSVMGDVLCQDRYVLQPRIV